MMSHSELPRSERISKAQLLLEEAKQLLGEYRQLQDQANEKLAAAEAKRREAEAMTPLPLFDNGD